MVERCAVVDWQLTQAGWLSFRHKTFVRSQRGCLSQVTHLAFDPTPMVSHLTLPPFWGRVGCEKVAFLAAKKRSRR